MSWYHIPGNEQDTVISTHVRFARNLTAYPFTSRLDAPRAREIVSCVGDILEKNGFSRVDFSDISRVTAQSLVEKHYASPLFARESLPHSLFLNEPCNLSVMVCEEDHVRLQCVLPGLSLKDAYAGAGKIEALLDGELEFAFDGHLGYLTACPSNLGTAMRASVVLCIPLLAAGRRVDALALQLDQQGLLLRGMFGEGSTTTGGLYRISNRMTLGISEEDILERLGNAADSLITAERRLRESLSGAELDRITDRVRRAEGILRFAHTLSTAEMISLLTDLRIGASLGLTNIRVEVLTALLVEAMPATLTSGAVTPPKNDFERDILRAATVQKSLFGA